MFSVQQNEEPDLCRQCTRKHMTLMTMFVVRDKKGLGESFKGKTFIS